MSGQPCRDYIRVCIRNDLKGRRRKSEKTKIKNIARIQQRTHAYNVFLCVCACVYICVNIILIVWTILCVLSMDWSRLKQAHRIGIDPLNVEIDVIIQGWGLQVKHTHTYKMVSVCMCVYVCTSFACEKRPNPPRTLLRTDT